MKENKAIFTKKKLNNLDRIFEKLRSCLLILCYGRRNDIACASAICYLWRFFLLNII